MKPFFVFVFAFSLLALNPLIADQALQQLLEEHSQIRYELDQVRIAHNEAFQSEPWESDQDIITRRVTELAQVTQELREREASVLNELRNLRIVLPASSVTQEVGAYDRNARYWPLFMEINIEGRAQPLQLQYSLADSPNIQADYRRFDEAIKANRLRTELSYSLDFMAGENRYFRHNYLIIITDYEPELSISTPFISQEIPGPSLAFPIENLYPYPDYQVGDRGPAGGVIAYKDEADEFTWTYLEVAPQDIENLTVPVGRPWVNQSPEEGIPGDIIAASWDYINPEIKLYDFFDRHRSATSTYVFPDLGAGPHNTRLLRVGTITYAGAQDWVVPSEAELSLISRRIQIEAIEGVDKLVYALYRTSSNRGVVIQGLVNRPNQSLYENNSRIRLVRFF